MNYQERNLAVLAEVREKLRFKRGIMIGKPIRLSDAANKTTFTAVGSFHCDTLGSELFVGFKEDDDPEHRFVTDLRVARTLSERYPQLLSMLPAFVGLAIDKLGVYRGVLTEDFSQAGRFPVREADKSHPELPRYLHPLFNVKDGEETEFTRMFFEVNRKLRLGDMNTALVFVDPADKIERFPCIDIENNLDRYIIRLDT